MEKQKINKLLIILFLFSVSSFCGGWKLEWSDEFDGNALNESNWMIRVANPRWVNNEEQRYTAGYNQPNSNIFVKNGFLIIEARKSSNGEITSGRIEGLNKKSFQYGRMEAKMRLPISKGYWPAFWMLGTIGGWPSCGEIDIFEGKGRLPYWIQGAFHCNLGLNLARKEYTFPQQSGNVHDSFHIYAIEWSQDSIRWYADKENFLTLLRSQHPGIPIDRPYYYIINVAIGGVFDGPSDNTTIFPESLIVDYVRVYKWDPSLDINKNKKTQTKDIINITDRRDVIIANINLNEPYTYEIVLPSGKAIKTKQIIKDNIIYIPKKNLLPGVYLFLVKTKYQIIKKQILLE